MRSLWIDGGWQDSSGGGARAIVNPATLEHVDEVDGGDGRGRAPRCAAAAAEAQQHWRRMPALERGRLLHEAAGLMRADRAELSELLTREGGKPRIENLDEVEWCAACFQYYAEIARNAHGSSIPPTAEHQINFTIKEPLGVVAAIVPFNYPLLLLVWKIAPALAAGNTVVIKPSELTPLATLRMVERALAHLPRGVVNVVTGGPATGAALVDDPDVACIAFTGSTAVGTRIAERAAAAAEARQPGAWRHRSADRVRGRRPRHRGAGRGVGALPQQRPGLHVREAHLRRRGHRAGVHRALRRAHRDRCGSATAWTRTPTSDRSFPSRRARGWKRRCGARWREGARLLEGGQRLDAGPGWFYAPTVLTDVDRGNSVVCEEVFGPIASIQVVKDADDAIARAAASEYGLGANIYTQNLTWALSAMQEIKAGTFWINDPLTDNDAAPFGGMRKSGMGRELGEEGLDAFRETKHVHLDFVPERKAFWFPYARRRQEIPE